MPGRVTFAAFLMLAGAANVQAQVRPGGWVEYQAIVYQRDDPGGSVGRDQVRLQPEVDARLGRRARLFAAVELRGDLASPSRNRVYLDEGYGDLYLGSVDVRLGRQILAWGRADALNPTDYFGAWDYTDVLDADEEKLAQDGVRASWFFGRWTMEAVAVPRFTTSLIPAPGSRWWPSLDAGGSPGPIRAELVSATGPRDGRGAFGIRVSGTSGRFDMALSWYEGPWHLPMLVSGAPFLDPVNGTVRVTVTPTIGRLTALGADLATALGPVGIHAEAAAYLFPDSNASDAGVEEPFARYVVGGDYTLQGVLGGRNVALLAEWIQDVPLVQDARPWDAFDLNHVFRQSLFLRATVPTGDFSNVALQGLYDVDGSGWVAQVEADWRPREGLGLRLACDLPGGPPHSFFGAFRDNRRLHARVRYSL